MQVMKFEIFENFAIFDVLKNNYYKNMYFRLCNFLRFSKRTVYFDSFTLS